MLLAKNTPVILARSTKPLENAAGILRRDLEAALEESFLSSGSITVQIPEEENPLDESYRIDVTDDDIKIMAASSLGGVYGLLRVSEQFLGVAPFWFWADLPPAKAGMVEAPCGVYHSGPFNVRFRGWFLNDEVLLEAWRPVPREPDFAWRMAFEALLRLGGNMAIPGTDQNSRKYRKLAADMGLWITHHHAEPLGAELFSRAHPKLEPSFKRHSGLFLELWRAGVASQRGCNVVWALGFRGQGDRPFWEDDPEFDTPGKRGRVISDVIRRQYDIVLESCENPVCCVNLYGEILELYRAGHIEFPDDVICVWADSGYGKMVSRRQTNHNPRIPALPAKGGAHGVYYHASFYDLQASGHITTLPNPPELVCSELRAAFAAGADDYLLVNCGNVRPHVYILDLIAGLWANGASDAGAHAKAFAAKYFSGLPDVAERFALLGKSTLKYGAHPDEKAGEQFYHHPVRELSSAWMQGRTGACVESLKWLRDSVFKEQLAHYRALLEKSAPILEAFAKRCEETREGLDKNTGRRFFDLLGIQARIHTFGAEGALWFCRSFAAFDSGDAPRAFCHAWRAKESFSRSLADFAESGHGLWRGWYDNECLTDIRLTVTFMETLMAWLRITAEGADRQLWHRQYLMNEADRGVMLVTNFYRPLPDDGLAKEMAAVLQ